MAPHRWQKGESGNPNGRRRKERGLTEELRHLLDAKWEPQGWTNRQLLIQGLLCDALTGSLDAKKYIFDRMEGKPAQALELAGDKTRPLVIKYVDGNTT